LMSFHWHVIVDANRFCQLDLPGARQGFPRNLKKSAKF
jgi:hypothetical protein